MIVDFFFSVKKLEEAPEFFSILTCNKYAHDRDERVKCQSEFHGGEGIPEFWFGDPLGGEGILEFWSKKVTEGDIG